MSHFAYFVQSVFVDREGTHQSTCCREEAVGEAVTELECLYSNLSCNACKVSNRNHKRHNCCSLSGTGRNERLINRFATNMKFAPRMEPIPDIGMDSQ